MFQQAFKTIIVGVDFSNYSKIVVKQAQYLCKLWNTKLVLVHSISDPVVYASNLYISFPNVLDSKHYKSRITKTYSIKSSEVKIIAERDIPSELLERIADKHPQSMIMVGYTGMSALASFFFGSTAQNMAMKSKHPVWIQRGKKIIEPKKIMIPHDLTLKSNKAIDIFQKLALTEPLSAEIFHVQDKVFPVLDFNQYMQLQKKLILNTRTKISETLKNYRSIPVVTRQGAITDKILRRTNKFDLLIMTHHNPTGLFTKSETASLLKKIKTPVLITHTNDKL
jgi:nucleotide-binding universal stress UspA family protein